jgi:trigger factor
MQVVEKSSEGLSKVLEVTVPIADLNQRLDAKIKEIGPRVNLKGFRPGKVPASHVRKLFGRDLMGEIVQETLNASSQEALDKVNVRPAAPAEVKLSSDIDKVIAGEIDLAYEMAVEIMPNFVPIDPTTISLVRPVYQPSDEDLDASLNDLMAQTRSYEAKEGKAKDGDMVVMDFVGSVDGEVFEGGSSNDAQLVLGSGQFIPGFEDQLVGVKAGDEKTVKVTFPEAYAVATLAGKDAEFAVTVKEVRGPKDSKADDEFAKRIGFDTLDALKTALRGQLEQQYAGQSRFRLKRRLLDELDARHDFVLPEKMVENEFKSIWTQVEADKEKGALPPEDADKSEAELRKEYREIAERRVRLGLVLAEIGRRGGVTVTDQELSNAVMNEARAYPGREREVIEFYRTNPQAAAQLRAPVYEEKVCDWLFNVAKVTDEDVSKDDLYAEDDVPTEASKKAKAKGHAEKAEAKANKDEAKPKAEAKAKASKTEAKAEGAAEPKAKAKKPAAKKK